MKNLNYEAENVAASEGMGHIVMQPPSVSTGGAIHVSAEIERIIDLVKNPRVGSLKMFDVYRTDRSRIQCLDRAVKLSPWLSHKKPK